MTKQDRKPPEQKGFMKETFQMLPFVLFKNDKANKQGNTQIKMQRSKNIKRKKQEGRKKEKKKTERE